MKNKKKSKKGGAGRPGSAKPGSSFVNYDEATGIKVPKRVADPRQGINAKRRAEQIVAQDEVLRQLAKHYRVVPTWFHNNLTPTGPPDTDPSKPLDVSIVGSSGRRGAINLNFIKYIQARCKAPGVTIHSPFSGNYSCPLAATHSGGDSGYLTVKLPFDLKFFSSGKGEGSKKKNDVVLLGHPFFLKMPRSKHVEVAPGTFTTGTSIPPSEIAVFERQNAGRRSLQIIGNEFIGNNYDSRSRTSRLYYGPRARLYHITPREVALCILKSGTMLCGSGGMVGGGIYFGIPKEIFHKIAVAGGASGVNKGHLIIKANVYLGNILNIVIPGGVNPRAPGDDRAKAPYDWEAKCASPSNPSWVKQSNVRGGIYNITFERLQSGYYGGVFDSVHVWGRSGDEWVVYRSDQVEVRGLYPRGLAGDPELVYRGKVTSRPPMVNSNPDTPEVYHSHPQAINRYDISLQEKITQKNNTDRPEPIGGITALGSGGAPAPSIPKLPKIIGVCPKKYGRISNLFLGHITYNTPIECLGYVVTKDSSGKHMISVIEVIPAPPYRRKPGAVPVLVSQSDIQFL